MVCAHLSSCLAWNACSEESSGYYKFCVEDGYKFCCGGWGGDTESCGDNIGNCRKKNSGYIKCEEVLKAEGILALISMIFLITVIVMVCMHKRKKQQSVVFEQMMRLTDAVERDNVEQNRRLLNRE